MFHIISFYFYQSKLGFCICFLNCQMCKCDQLSHNYMKHNLDYPNFSCTTIIAAKVPKYGVFSGPYFPVLGLNTEVYSVSPRIQSEYWKICSEKTPYLDTFHAAYNYRTF